MPAIKKISKEAIIDAAVDVLREGGATAINARSVAKKLGCSTQPIYLSFQNMDDLKAAMTQRAIALHTRHVRNSNSDTQYSCYGMGFVKFAAEERHLFRWLYLDGEQFGPYRDDVLLPEIIAAMVNEYGYTEEVARKLHQDMTYYSYGMAILANTGHLNLTDAELRAAFRREFTALTVSPVPLAYYLRITGIVIWAVLAAVTLFAALAVEKKKKQFDIQTYREIIAFSEGKRLDEIEKERENGKRSYQKMLLIMGSGIITLIIAVVIACLVYVNIITTERRIPASFQASPSGNEHMTAVVIAQMPVGVGESVLLQALHYPLRRKLRRPHGVHLGGDKQNGAGDVLGLYDCGGVRLLHKRQIQVVHAYFAQPQAFPQHLAERELLHHIGQRKGRQPASLKDARQHSGKLYPAVTAAEKYKRLSRIFILRWDKKLTEEAVCLHAKSFIFCCGFWII